MPAFEKLIAQRMLDVNSGYTNGVWYARRGQKVFYTDDLGSMLAGKFPDNVLEEMTSAGVEDPMADKGSLVANDREIIVWSSNDKNGDLTPERDTVQALQAIIGPDIPVRPLRRK